MYLPTTYEGMKGALAWLVYEDAEARARVLVKERKK